MASVLAELDLSNRLCVLDVGSKMPNLRVRRVYSANSGHAQSVAQDDLLTNTHGPRLTISSNEYQRYLVLMSPRHQSFYVNLTSHILSSRVSSRYGEIEILPANIEVTSTRESLCGPDTGIAVPRDVAS